VKLNRNLRPAWASLRVCFRPSQVWLAFLIVPLTLFIATRVSRGSSPPIDPGPRGGPPGVGGPLSGLTQQESKQFADGQSIIQEIDSVSGTVPGTGSGLGPRFNMDSCAGCHNFPAPGGSSPPVNPMIAAAAKNGATNTIPFFITPNGPIRRQFLIVETNPPMEKHLFTITGRADAPGCVLTQPDFNSIASNLSFHIPLPLYGDGLVDAIDNSTLRNNLASNGAAKSALGISGHGAGPGGGGRFFWKDSSGSLSGVAAGAYQGEVGVTNALFSQENDPNPACHFNKTPEDTFTLSEGLPDFQKISNFIEFSSGPTPIADTPSIVSGRSLFASVGCALCHTPSLQTGNSSSQALGNKPVPLYSDLALHHMGSGLADGIVMRDAAGDEFRTQPLWGLGQRVFFLHDGRTMDLTVAISAHKSGGTPPSEANAVVDQYNALSDDQKQDILNFLRSL
jgi:CxxC motif-containing protein (DUF1111 family)